MLRLKSTTISNIHFLVLGWSNWRVFLSGAAVNQIKNWWNLLGLICFIEMRYIARRSQLDILFVATSTTPCPLLINGPQEVLGKHRRMYRITIKQPTARLTLRFHCSSHLLPLPVPANHRYLIALLGCRTPPLLPCGSLFLAANKKRTPNVSITRFPSASVARLNISALFWKWQKKMHATAHWASQLCHFQLALLRHLCPLARYSIQDEKTWAVSLALYAAFLHSPTV